jgi:hypothetical protein
MASVIVCRNSERGFFPRWVKVAIAEQTIQTRQGRFEFVQEALLGWVHNLMNSW